MDSLVQWLSPSHASHISLTWWSAVVLAAAGILGGFVNTLAGGGSMITVPALMLLGMPADHANGTNRVGILLQSLTGIRGFNRWGKLEKGAILPMLIPTVSGAALGAISTTWAPPRRSQAGPAGCNDRNCPSYADIPRCSCSTGGHEDIQLSESVRLGS